MKKPKLTIFIGLIIATLLSLVCAYWFFFSKPTTFLTDEQLLEELNSTFKGVDAKTIQDKIFIDDHHVVVPFVSTENEYSLSYWEWKMRKWQVATIENSGELRLWKIDQNDPSSYQFVWNIHPEDQLSTISIYLIRERGFIISDEEERYFPKVQMVKTIDLAEQPYGVMQLPEDWVAFMEESNKIESPNTSGFLFNNFQTRYSMYFGWIGADQSGNVAYPEHSFNGQSYSTSNINLEYVMILNEQEIEQPSKNN